VVLVKCNIGAPGSRWSDVFVEDEGVPVEFRGWGERRTFEGQRAEAAERWGRNAYTQRTGKAADRPEGADTGVKVWGKPGLFQMHVGIVELISELKAAGFVLTWVSVLRREQMEDVLVMAWTSKAWIEEKGPGLFEVDPPPSFGRFIATSFDVCHVYANPIDENKDGVVEHTVNLARRQGEPAWYNLHFAGGQWGVASVAAPAPKPAPLESIPTYEREV
jgi:hypothetical protein